MPISLAMRVIAALWVVFLVYWWLIAARNVKQTETKEGVASRAANRILVVVGAVLLFEGRWTAAWRLSSRFVQPGPGVETAGVLVVVAGILVALWARRHLGRNWSGIPALKVNHELIRTGPYAYLRHPIYVGLGIALAGTALAEGVWRGGVGALIICFAFWRKARLESAFLARRFGPEAEQR
ncbi:MAG: methyltransferase [Terriglobia bacterium]